MRFRLVARNDKRKKKRHSVLYKANRRSEVRTSEPVCSADTESLHWDGALLLPLIGEGWDGEYPARDSRRHSEQRSKAERDSESPARG